jgi:predicted nucleotidyltransferase
MWTAYLFLIGALRGVYRMPTSTTIPSLERIRAVAGQIAERFRPQKVILFGSYAYGHPTSDSDVDLLVLLDSSASTLQRAAIISKQIDHPFPLDIVVLSPSDWDEYLREGAVFPKLICEKGLVLYEANDPRVD